MEMSLLPKKLLGSPQKSRFDRTRTRVPASAGGVPSAYAVWILDHLWQLSAGHTPKHLCSRAASKDKMAVHALQSNCTQLLAACFLDQPHTPGKLSKCLVFSSSLDSDEASSSWTNHQHLSHSFSCCLSSFHLWGLESKVVRGLHAPEHHTGQNIIKGKKVANAQADWDVLAMYMMGTNDEVMVEKGRRNRPTSAALRRKGIVHAACAGCPGRMCRQIHILWG